MTHTSSKRVARLHARASCARYAFFTAGREVGLMINKFFYALFIFGWTVAVSFSVVDANAAKSLTIQSSQNSETETLMLPDDAVLDIDVTANGIVLTIPNVNLSVKCLGLASAKDTCTLTAGGGQSGDADGDGVPDNSDQCPDTPSAALTGSSGCSQNQLDDDQDGVVNGGDQCPNTPANTQVDANGCSDAQNGPLDADSDGVPDGSDQCPNTPANTQVDAVGCPTDDPTDTSQYCSNPEPGASVRCSRSKSLDSIYVASSIVNHAFNSREVLSLPFSTADKSNASGLMFGSLRLVSDEPALPGGTGQPRVRVWYSLNPAGAALPGAMCSGYYQEATTSVIWAQFTGANVCKVAELNQSRIVYLNVAVACNLDEEGCTTSNQYPTHNGYSFRLTKYFQE